VGASRVSCYMHNRAVHDGGSLRAAAMEMLILIGSLTPPGQLSLNCFVDRAGGSPDHLRFRFPERGIALPHDITMTMAVPISPNLDGSCPADQDVGACFAHAHTCIRTYVHTHMDVHKGGRSRFGRRGKR